MKVKISYYRPCENPDNSVIGYVGVEIVEPDINLFLSKCRVVRAKSGHIFISPPSEPFTDKDGVEKYGKFFWFGKKKSEEFNSAVVDEINNCIQASTPGAPLLSSSQKESESTTAEVSEFAEQRQSHYLKSS